MKLLKRNFTFITLFILIIMLPLYAAAQNNMVRCGTDEQMQKQLENPEFAAKYYELKAQVAQKTSSNKKQAPCDNPLVIPIVVHYQSTSISEQCMADASLAQVDQLNRDFSSCNKNADKFCEWIETGCIDFGGDARGDAMPDDGTCIQFCLADQNLPADTNLTPGGLAITTGYSADNQDAPPMWNKYLNIYVGEMEDGVLGFVFFLSGAADTNTSLGASVIPASFGAYNFTGCEGIGTDTYYNGGATLTHEIGHWFGLDHTFEDALADTPPQSTPNLGCPSVNTNTCTTDALDGYSGNFMDYCDDECIFNFSQNQVDVMLATVASQNNWATNSISCSPVYPPCGEANQAGACAKACPSSIVTQISLSEDACGETSITTFPDEYGAGLRANENTDLKFTWSIGNYLSAGGTEVAAPIIQKATGCNLQKETYYLNVDCETNPLNTTLDGGTYVITAYPEVPDDIMPLISISEENSCNEPIVVPVAGCETYLDIVANSENPSFPVSNGNSGIATYNVTFKPNTAGPNCCEEANKTIVIGGAINDGDLEVLGAGGNSPWSSTSTVFGSVMCSGGTCGSAPGISYNVPPNSGNWLAWFGGIDEFEEGTIEGDFVIPSCSNGQTIFSFGFQNEPCLNADDFIQLQVDGNVVWNYDVDPANCDNLGRLQLITLDFSAYADDTSHNLLFTSKTVEGSATSFTIDNIQLINESCSAEIICTYSVDVDYNCDIACTDEIDCEGQCGGSATPGSSCNDNDGNTINDIYLDDCSCAGQLSSNCSDGIKNGDETGIDCGGNCPDACDTDCGNEAGLMQTSNSFVCNEAVVYVREIFSTVDENSVRAYVLHEDEEFDGTNYIAINDRGRFTSPAPNYTNRPVYISAIFGPPNENGMPKLDDDCTTWSSYGAEYTFFDPVSISIVDERCEDNQHYVDISISGGVGGISPGLAYRSVYDGTNLYLNLSKDEVVTFGPYTDSGDFKIVARDAKGCIGILEKSYICNNLNRTVSHSPNSNIVNIAYNNKEFEIKNIETYNLQAQQIPAIININEGKSKVEVLNEVKGLYVIKVLLSNNKSDYIKIYK